MIVRNCSFDVYMGGLLIGEYPTLAKAESFISKDCSYPASYEVMVYNKKSDVYVATFTYIKETKTKIRMSCQ